MVDLIHINAPSAVPSEVTLAAWHATFGNDGVIAFTQDSECVSSNFQVAHKLSRSRSAIPVNSMDALAEHSLPDDKAHDAFFYVRRVEGDAACVFVRMVLFARELLLREVDEAPVDISRPFLGEIDRALVDLMTCASGKNVGSAPIVEAWETRGSREDVLIRWLRGHQIFAALTQGLILSFKSIANAIRSGQGQEVRRWADLTVSLLRGSGASFVLTGDFSVKDYNDRIRPSMMPPAVPTCLSGLMSIDHRFLVQTIRDMKPALKGLRDQDKARHERIHEELKTVYDRHVFVCERFVGERPSLLTAGSTEKSGPELIKQFKTLRVKPFESQAHTARLHAESRSHPGINYSSSGPAPRPEDTEFKRQPHDL